MRLCAIWKAETGNNPTEREEAAHGANVAMCEAQGRTMIIVGFQTLAIIEQKFYKSIAKQIKMCYTLQERMFYMKKGRQKVT